MVFFLKRISVLLPADVGFEIPNRFVVGYALDYNEYFRDLNVSTQAAVRRATFTRDGREMKDGRGVNTANHIDALLWLQPELPAGLLSTWVPNESVYPVSCESLTDKNLFLICEFLSCHRL